MTIDTVYTCLYPSLCCHFHVTDLTGQCIFEALVYHFGTLISATGPYSDKKQVFTNCGH